MLDLLRKRGELAATSAVLKTIISFPHCIMSVGTRNANRKHLDKRDSDIPLQGSKSSTYNNVSISVQPIEYEGE